MPDTEMRDESELRYDAQAAERSYRDTAALRAEVRDPSAPRGLDLKRAALFGLRMAEELAKPEVKARFDRLPDDVLSAALRNRIAPAAWALWYTVVQRSTAEAGASAARVTEATLKQASEVKQRMMRVAEYMLADDPGAAVELASIRSGIGHADLAADLTRLGALYVQHRDAVSLAGAHYREGDVVAAKQAAAAILAELASAETPKEATAREEAYRAYRVLEEAYRTVRQFGLALFEDGEARFPSMYSGRAARGRSSGDAPAGGEPPAA